jgi:hypothetical protein
MLQRDVTVAGALVIQSGVAMGESAPSTILPREADMKSIEHE